MGRYCIKLDMQLCQGHGECAEEAPEVFEVDYDTSVYPKVRVLNAKPEDALREKVEAAARYCPNQVISVVNLEDLDSPSCSDRQGVLRTDPRSR